MNCKVENPVVPVQLTVLTEAVASDANTVLIRESVVGGEGRSEYFVGDTLAHAGRVVQGFEPAINSVLANLNFRAHLQKPSLTVFGAVLQSAYCHEHTSPFCVLM